MVEMVSVRSSNVESVGWDEDGQELLVKFKNGGTYAYSGQSEATMQDILTSPSPGSYVARHLRGRAARKIAGALAALALLSAPSVAVATEPPAWASAGPVWESFVGMKIVGVHKRVDVVHIDNPDQTVCILRIGDECILKYDGEVQAFIASRPWVLNVEARAKK